MENFKDYYQELIENVSPEYSVFGEFGKQTWYDMVSEGLITSYPKNKVKEFLKTININSSPIQVLDNDDYKDKKFIKIILPISNYDIEFIKNKLNKSLNVYGYYVGKDGNEDNMGRKTLLIEPKFPTLVNVDDIRDMFSHITHKKHLDKILKNGLSPRESSTTFKHPGGRIYLLQSDNDLIIHNFKSFLAKNKTHKFGKHGHTDLDFRDENMVILKVKLPPANDLYIDPMFGGGSEIQGYFTTQNIPPNFITM